MATLRSAPVFCAAAPPSSEDSESAWDGALPTARSDPEQLDELQPPLLFERLPLALSCLGIRFPASLLRRFRGQVGNDALLPQQVLLRLGSALALQRLLLLQPSSLTLRLRFVSSGSGDGTARIAYHGLAPHV